MQTDINKLEDALLKSEERYIGLINNLEAGVVVHAPNTSIVMSNLRASELLGLTEEQMVGKEDTDPAWRFSDTEGVALSIEDYPVNRVLATKKPIQNQVLGIHRPVTNDIVWVTVNGFPILNSTGDFAEIVISFIDITAHKLAEIELKKHQYCLEELIEERTTELQEQIIVRKQVEEEVRLMAMTDHLTNLSNRRHFKQLIEQSIKLAYREKKTVAMMMIDLDKFKPVNDSYGHQVGDALLQSVASILTKYSRDSDFVARLGGDEFAILVIHPENKEGVKVSAKRISDEIKKPIYIEEHKIEISASIGIALYPENAKNDEELIKNSDLALYEIKKRGGDDFLFYLPDMSVEK